jgi:hypothetical protein
LIGSAPLVNRIRSLGQLDWLERGYAMKSFSQLRDAVQALRGDAVQALRAAVRA